MSVHGQLWLFSVVVGGGHCGELGEVVGRHAHCHELGGDALVPIEGVVVVIWDAHLLVVVLAREGDRGVQGVVMGG